jgi:hypothetical protein
MINPTIIPIKSDRWTRELGITFKLQPLLLARATVTIGAEEIMVRLSGWSVVATELGPSRDDLVDDLLVVGNWPVLVLNIEPLTQRVDTVM